MTGRTGSPGGRPVSDASCSNGLALRGLQGRTGASIDEAIGECSLIRDIAQRYDNPRTEFTQSVVRPRAAEGLLRDSVLPEASSPDSAP